MVSTPSSRRICSRAHLVACAALALLALPRVGVACDDHEDAVAALVGASGTGANVDAAALERDLAALGPNALAELFEALDHGYVLFRTTEREPARLVLEPPHVAALHGAAEHVPLAQVRAFVSELATAAVAPRTRRTAIEVLALRADESDVALLARLAAPGEGEERNAREVERATRDAFERALDAVLARSTQALWFLRDELQRAHPALYYPMVSAAGRTESPTALVVLGGLLERVDGLDALLLIEIARLGDVTPHPADEYVVSCVRRYLGHTDRALVQAAAGALGALEDYASLGELIDLVEADDRNLRRAALRAVQEITGLKKRVGASAWRAWHERELAWRREEAPRLYADLAGRDPAAASAAILALARRRTFRHEHAAHLARALDRPETDLIVQACAALASLGSQGVVKDLLPRLEHRHPAVEQAAWTALREITGLDLPPDSVLWAEATGRP